MIQLVLVEVVSSGALGLALVLIPLTLIRVLGLPKSETPFWPRVLGVVILGLSLASYMDATVRLGHGLGLAGACVINVVAGLGLAATLYLQRTPTRRGSIVLWATAGALVTLAAVELAYI